MKPSEQEYDKVVQKIGKGLAFKGRATEAGIINHCIKQIDSMVQKSGTCPTTLDALRDLVAAQLNLAITEIRSKADMDALLKKYPPAAEPVIARIPIELDDQTDAIVVHRPNCKEWDRPYLAVINCTGDHYYKRYFSKWHEIVHLLLEGRQMTFAFRRTHESERHQPLERLVDRVAGHLAFYSPLFKPVLNEQAESAGLTFDAIETVRKQISSEASRQATTIACVRNVSEPVMYARLSMSLTQTEKKKLAEPDMFPETQEHPQPKLRVKESFSSPAAQKMGLQIFPNMSISDESIASGVFLKGGTTIGQENFILWRGDGPVGRVAVEAVKIGDDVHCLIQAR